MGSRKTANTPRLGKMGNKQKKGRMVTVAPLSTGKHPGAYYTTRICQECGRCGAELRSNMKLLCFDCWEGKFKVDMKGGK